MVQKNFIENEFGTFVLINTTDYNCDGVASVFVCESIKDMSEVGLCDEDVVMAYRDMEVGDVWTCENHGDYINFEGVILIRIA